MSICSTPLTRTVRADGRGRYRKAIPFDLDGADLAVVSYSTSAGDAFEAITNAALFEVKAPGRASVRCARGGPHSVTLRRADGTIRASASPPSSPCKLAEPVTRRFRRNGDPVDVRVGDVVKADFARDARFVWPVMSVEPIVGGAIGRCFRNAGYLVVVVRSVSGRPTIVGSLGLGKTQMTARSPRTSAPRRTSWRATGCVSRAREPQGQLGDPGAGGHALVHLGGRPDPHRA